MPAPELDALIRELLDGDREVRRDGGGPADGLGAGRLHPLGPGHLLDADRDGVLDDQDVFDSSDTRDQVDTGGGPTSVPNVTDARGITLQDRVNALAAGAKNHGQYVSAIAHLANELRKAGLVTNAQSAELKRGAAQS
jgi:hypothetical protein